MSWTKIKKTASDEEDGEADEVLSLAGSVDAIWLEVVLSSEENAWDKGAGAGNVWDMVEQSKKQAKKFWHSRLKDVAVADNDCDEDDWESV